MKKPTLILILLICLGSISYAQTVTIGTQVWMSKNLDVSTFRNGDTIPQAKTEKEWIKAGKKKRPAWCYYDNEPANGMKYGKLYNGYAVNDSRGLAPVGYHISTGNEWGELEDFLGSEVGNKMKSESGWYMRWSGIDTTVCPKCINWDAEYRSKVTCNTCRDYRFLNKITNGNGTNTSGFSGLPGGWRHPDGTFYHIEKNGAWWVLEEIGFKFFRFLQWNNSELGYDSFPKASGLSVRCLRD